MRSFYKEFFYVPKFGRVREKVLLARVTVTVSLMILCLAAMSFAAYAYFSAGISSDYNIIKGANFNATVTVSDKNGDPVALTLAEKNKYKVTLDADTEYTVNLIPDGTAETGFCVITAEGSDSVYYTQQLGKDAAAENGKTPVISFKLKLSETAVVTVFAHWGTSSYYDAYSNQGVNGEFYITDGELVEINLSSPEEPEQSGDTEPVSENVTETNTDTDTTPDTNTEESEPETEPATLPETKPEETEPELDTDPNTDPDTETDPETETKTDTAAEPEADGTATE